MCDNNKDEIQFPYGIDKNFRDELRAQFEINSLNNSTSIINQNIEPSMDDNNVQKKTSKHSIHSEIHINKTKSNESINHNHNDNDGVNNDAQSKVCISSENKDLEIVVCDSGNTVTINKDSPKSQLNDSQELHN